MKSKKKSKKKSKNNQSLLESAIILIFIVAIMFAVFAALIWSVGVVSGPAPLGAFLLIIFVVALFLSSDRQQYLH